MSPQIPDDAQSQPQIISMQKASSQVIAEGVEDEAATVVSCGRDPVWTKSKATTSSKPLAVEQSCWTKLRGTSQTAGPRKTSGTQS